MAEVKLASTLDHIGNVAQISPLIGFVHKDVVIVDTEPELEKSEFSVMSLEKCVKQLEKKEQQKRLIIINSGSVNSERYNASCERQEMGQFKYGVELAETSY